MLLGSLLSIILLFTTAYGDSANPSPAKASIAGGGNPSLGKTATGKKTQLELYKAMVYRAVGARWFPKIGEKVDVLAVGHVRVQYTIYSDGSLQIKQQDEGDNALNSALYAISVSSMWQAAPFPTFSPALRNEVGDSFTDDFTFSVYNNVPPQNASPPPHDSGESKPDQAPPAQAPVNSLPGID